MMSSIMSEYPIFTYVVFLKRPILIVLPATKRPHQRSDIWNAMVALPFRRHHKRKKNEEQIGQIGVGILACRRIRHSSSNYSLLDYIINRRDAPTVYII
jgi:hypothetical protein